MKTLVTVPDSVRRAPVVPGQPLVGNLGRWGLNPLSLLREGAELADVFELDLWRRTVVGHSPRWNQFVLGDLDTFRSRGSLSSMSPYLNAGVVHTDVPAHRQRRQQVNPHFTRSSVNKVHGVIDRVVRDSLPSGEFDAVPWSSFAVQRILSAVFLGHSDTHPAVSSWLRPMAKPLPRPFIPHPIRQRRYEKVLQQAMDDTSRTSHHSDRFQPLAGVFAGLEDGLNELRVSVAAGYDTTAHTMAWLLALSAANPALLSNYQREHLVNEVLRMYPAGWVGSRLVHHDVEFDGIDLPAGTMVLYSPYLTHRDWRVWPLPLNFDPSRFESDIPAWSFIPFASGPRMCLGRHLSMLILTTVLDVVAETGMTWYGGDVSPAAGLTLRPRGPLNIAVNPKERK